MSTRAECLQLQRLIDNYEKSRCWVDSYNFNIDRPHLSTSSFALKIVVGLSFDLWLALIPHLVN